MAEIAGAAPGAINNEEDPVIVGLSAIERPCACNASGEDAWVYSGFACVYDGSPSLDELDPLLGDMANSAFDLNTPSSGGAMVVGHSRCWTPNVCEIEISGGACVAHVESAAWDASMLTGDGLDRLASHAHVARGVNDDNLAVGWGYNASNPCFSTAVYWPDAVSPFNLGSIMPRGQDEDESRAEAINDLAFPWSVGWNVNLEHGVLWIKNGSGDDDWEAYDLNTLIGPNTIECDESPVTAWEILKAHDINDSNWIVGTAYHTCIPGEHAVLLTPIGTCPWDLSGDDEVDEDDVNILGISSGCQPSRICYEDVNNDLVIDSQDLADIMNNFGECPGWGSPFTESYVTYWAIGGGWDALRNQEITGSQIADALNEPTEVEQIAALYSLLGQ